MFHRAFFDGLDDDEHADAAAPDAPPAAVDNKRLYEILEVEPTATLDQIKAAYKALAKKHHPDRGGDPEKFKEVNAANEVLSDPDKRRLYDRLGADGLKGGAAQGGDLFETLFGRGGGGGPRAPPKLKPIARRVEVTLDDVYAGKMEVLDVERNVVCAACEGRGGRNPAPCAKCEGRGATLRMVQVAPGMFSRAQARCDDCAGEGETFAPGDACATCNKAKTVARTDRVEVAIPVGTPDDHQIVVKEKGHEFPGCTTGDLVVVVAVRPHAVFRRRKHDLLLTKRVALIEALTGFRFNVRLFDRDVTIESPRDRAVAHREVLVVPHLGLPHFRAPLTHGDLLVEFEVELPPPLAGAQAAALAALLPPPLLPPAEPTKNTYECGEAAARVGEGEGEGEEHDDDEGEEGHGAHGQRVECNHQ